MVGTTISHYQILAKLGEGGMGVVYKAHDTTLERDVALKFLPFGLQAQESGRARFLQEARAAALLNHPHICTIHEIGEAQEQPFIVMEYVEGETLSERIAKGLEYQEALTFAIQIAEALQEAHCHGIVHRDVKSENIMINAKNQAKIMDFGLAKLKGSLHLTKTCSTVGTLAYMAPEQIEGREVDARSDIFSFGIVLYEMLTGRLPFRGEHEAAMMYSILNEEPTPIQKYLPETSSELEHILSRALQKNPEDRYPHIDEMATELRRLKKTASRVSRGGLASEPSMGEIRSAGRRSRRFLNRRPATGALIAAGLLCIAGLSFFLFFRPHAKLVGNRVAVALFDNQTGDPELEAYGSLLSESVAQGLTAVAAVDVVPASDALRVWQQEKSRPDRADVITSFARQTGAKLVVTGAYYKQGDSLLIHAGVTDAETGKNVKVVSPIGCTSKTRIQAIDPVRQRLLGAIAFEFDPWGSPTYAQSPGYFPTFDAYREFKTGTDMFMRTRFAESLNHFRKSVDLDPTFQAPLGWMALAQWNLQDFKASDSLVQCLDSLRPTLVTMDLQLLNWLQACLRGDNVSCLELAREWNRRGPWHPLAAYQLGFDALKNNRPHEAMAAFLRLDPSDTTSFRKWASTWTARTFALHLMREHEQELKEAGKARQDLPDRIGMIGLEMKALAALGRIDEIWRKFGEACAFPQTGGTAAELIVSCASELSYHGFPEASRQAAEKAIDWYLSRPDSEQQGKRAQAALANAYYAGERFADAQKIYRQLSQQNPDNVDYQGYAGAIAARLGDTAEARRIDEVLKRDSRPYLFGKPTYWRARIASLLGEKDRAVTLLRDALSQGQDCSRLHPNMDLEKLRDYPPFSELAKVKD